MHGFGTEALRGRDNVNRRVARADASDSTAHLNFRERAELCRLNKLEGTTHAKKIFAGERESVCFTEADADENGVKFAFELGELDVAADRGLLAEFNAKSTSRSESAARVL
jgi:hypothetical protein